MSMEYGENSSFISLAKRIAPVGYARLFERYGDFYSAQEELSSAINNYYQHWKLITSTTVSKALEHVVNLAPRIVSKNVSESSFSQSKRLKTQEEAVDILKTFAGKEQNTLFLKYVEEIPDEQIMKWLAVDSLFIANLEKQLSVKVDLWRPEITLEESNKAFFDRVLRQYRLSQTFYESISSNVSVKKVSILNPGRIIMWIILIPIIFFVVLAFTSLRGIEPPVSYAFLYFIYNSPDFVVLTLSLVTLHYIANHAPSKTQASLSIYRTLLRIMNVIGIILLVITLLAGISYSSFGLFPDLRYHDNYCYDSYNMLMSSIIVPIAKVIWLIAITITLILAFYRIAVHYLGILNRLAIRKKEQETIDIDNK